MAACEGIDLQHLVTEQPNWALTLSAAAVCRAQVSRPASPQTPLISVYCFQSVAFLQRNVRVTCTETGNITVLTVDWPAPSMYCCKLLTVTPDWALRSVPDKRPSAWSQLRDFLQRLA